MFDITCFTLIAEDVEVTDTGVNRVLSVARIAHAGVWRNTVTIHTWR